jgi:hypothetical protein
MTKPLTQAQQEAQLRRLELATLSAYDAEPSRSLEWAAYQLVLTAAGIDPVTLEWDGSRYDGDDVRQRLIEPLRHIWLHLQAEVPGFVPLSLADRRPIHAMGRALKMAFGLNHRRVSCRSKPYTGSYAPDLERLEQRRTLLAKRREQ